MIGERCSEVILLIALASSLATNLFQFWMMLKWYREDQSVTTHFDGSEASGTMEP
jgi:hypothetical protein